MLTEDEAKTKECRVGGRNISGYWSHCTASDCGHWVWEKTPQTAAKQSCMDTGYYIEATGHCGLIRG